jgi:hypothetical protein
MQLVRDAERKTLIIIISLTARFFREYENCRHRQQNLVQNPRALFPSSTRPGLQEPEAHVP